MFYPALYRKRLLLTPGLRVCAGYQEELSSCGRGLGTWGRYRGGGGPSGANPNVYRG